MRNPLLSRRPMPVVKRELKTYRLIQLPPRLCQPPLRLAQPPPPCRFTQLPPRLFQPWGRLIQLPPPCRFTQLPPPPPCRLIQLAPRLCQPPPRLYQLAAPADEAVSTAPPVSTPPITAWDHLPKLRKNSRRAVVIISWVVEGCSSCGGVMGLLQSSAVQRWEIVLIVYPGPRNVWKILWVMPQSDFCAACLPIGSNPVPTATKILAASPTGLTTRIYQ